VKMQLSPKVILWTLFGLLVAGAITYMVVNWYEIEDDESWIGMQGEARTNPYLAMTRTLEAMGAKTETVAGSDEWEAALKQSPKGSTLLLGDRRLVRMTPQRVQAIHAWVQAGGNLIVEAEQPKFDDPLLAAYGIGHVGLRWTSKGWVEKRDRAKGEPEDESTLPFPLDPESLGDEVDNESDVARRLREILRKKEKSRIVFADGNGFDVAFQPYQNLRALKVPSTADVISDKTGIRVIQLADGTGQVTAISNFDFMTRRQIAENDHAEFVWHMVATQNAQPAANAKTSPRVLLALRDTEGGLWKWLMQHAWMVMVAVAVLLLLWLARIVPRFGPLLPAPSLDRRSLAEHFRALGRFVANENGWPQLAYAARERFLKRLYRERPGLSRAGKETLLATLEKLSGVGVARIERSLIAPVQDKRSFTDVVRSLKAIEQALEHRRANSQAS
jgi:hypothetical protein